MKKVLSLCLLLCSIGSCDKLSELTKFNIKYTDNITIPSSTGVNLPFDIFTPDIETNSTSKFESNNTNKDLIEDIRLIELELKLISPENADFSFLESIVIYISAEGLDEIEIASSNDIPDEIGAVLTLETVDVDLQDYIKKDSYSLRVNTVTDEVISRDHDLEIKSTFFVDAKILGL